VDDVHLTMPTLATAALTAVGALVSCPVLFQGFRRRGKGVKYERNFVIQRLPQLVSLTNIALIIYAFLAGDGVIKSPLLPAVHQGALLGGGVAPLVSWLGVAVLVSGLVFMIGGWYSLGEAFSTDAELLDGQTVKKDGLLRFVMHPAYSGIIQSLLGASIAALSLPCVLFTAFVVAPLWLNRAKYEEKLLVDTFGESYVEYGKQLKWRRLIPSFFPIGI